MNEQSSQSESATSQDRKRDGKRILITGTPATGKSSIARNLAETLGYILFDVNKIVKEKNFTENYDETYDTYILDEDRLLDFLEVELNSTDRGIVIDYHSCDLFPKRWIDLVIVLRCDNTILYDRFVQRNYSQKKINENLECEIFGTIAEEARESFDPTLVYELKNETQDDLAANIKAITNLINK